MSTHTVIIMFYSLTVLSSIAQVCISSYVLYLIIVRRQIVREHRIDYLLFANSYIATFFLGIFFIDLSAYSIYGYNHSEISFDGWWCRGKCYLMYISAFAFYYTCALQAIYRLCCILYPTKVRLRSFCLYTILSVGLWLLAPFELLPSLMIGDIEYLPSDYHCQFAPTSLRGSFTVYSVGFVFPFSVTVFCYVWTMCHIRQQTAALLTIRQQVSLKRDVIILKRLMLFLSIVTTMATPHLLLPIVYIIIGSLPVWIISFEWFLTALALVIISSVLLFAFPHLRKLCFGPRAVHPVQIAVVTAP